MRSNHLVTLIPVLAALAAATPQASAQSTPAGTFGEVVEVELVNVDVWVTDGDGNPIVGLTRDDFEVREDGNPVEITLFEEYRNEGLGAVLAAPPESSDPRPVEGPAPAPEPAPAHLVVYFDELRLAPAHTTRVIRDLRVFLATGTLAADRVMILRQTTELRIEAPFGSSLEQLDRALDRLEGTATRGTALEKELVIQSLEILWRESLNSFTDPCGQFMRRAGIEVERYASEAAARGSVTLRHLWDVAGFLAGLPGVKTLLYVGDSLETTPGTEFVAWVEDVCPLVPRGGRGFPIPENLGEPFFRLTRHANANRVMIYALQATGLRPGPSGSANRSSSNLSGTPLARSFESSLRLNERQGLTVLADQTGGRVLANSNRYTDELQAMGQEMSTYYSLAYEPPHGGDGAEHRIDVRVVNPRFRVRHRQGYRDKGPDEKMEQRLDGAIFLGLMDNPLQARLGAGAVRPAADDRFLLPLHVLVPIEKAVFLPGEGASTARFTLRAIARDDRNRKAAEETRWLVSELPLGDFTEMVDLAIALELPAGRYVVAVAVRDEASQETSYLSTTLQIRSPPKEGTG